jgi:enoyl-coA hydratase
MVPTGAFEGSPTEGTGHDGADLTAVHERLRTECWNSDDAAEARAARSEKRSPVFKGK